MSETREEHVIEENIDISEHLSVSEKKGRAGVVVGLEVVREGVWGRKGRAGEGWGEGMEGYTITRIEAEYHHHHQLPIIFN